MPAKVGTHTVPTASDPADVPQAFKEFAEGLKYIRSSDGGMSLVNKSGVTQFSMGKSGNININSQGGHSVFAWNQASNFLSLYRVRYIHPSPSGALSLVNIAGITQFGVSPNGNVVINDKVGHQVLLWDNDKQVLYLKKAVVVTGTFTATKSIGGSTAPASTGGTFPSITVSGNSVLEGNTYINIAEVNGKMTKHGTVGWDSAGFKNIMITDHAANVEHTGGLLGDVVLVYKSGSKDGVWAKTNQIHGTVNGWVKIA